MVSFDLFYDRIELSLFSLQNDIRIVSADHGKVSGNNDNIKPVYLLKLFFLCSCSSSHACQLVVHAEVVLESNRCQGQAFPLNLNPFLRFDGLVESVAVPPSEHQPSCELVNYYCLAVFNDIVPVALHQRVGTKGLVQMVHYLYIGLI